MLGSRLINMYQTYITRLVLFVYISFFKLMCALSSGSTAWALVREGSSFQESMVLVQDVGLCYHNQRDRMQLRRAVVEETPTATRSTAPQTLGYENATASIITIVNILHLPNFILGIPIVVLTLTIYDHLRHPFSRHPDHHHPAAAALPPPPPSAPPPSPPPPAPSPPSRPNLPPPPSPSLPPPLLLLLLLITIFIVVISTLTISSAIYTTTSRLQASSCETRCAAP